MPSRARATSTSTVLFPPPREDSQWFYDDDERRTSSSLRATCRESSVARSRRRSSISHAALVDIQAQQSSLSPVTPSHRTPSRASSVSSVLTDTLLPTVSPTAPSQYEAYSPEKPYLPGQPKSLSGIALRAFCLGSALATGLIATLAVLLFTSSPLWRLPFFLASLSTFHFLEFWTTAAYNTREAEVSSFLLTANWPAYAIAHTAAAVECLVTNVFFPGRRLAPVAGLGAVGMVLGLLLVAVGQVVRSAAMVQAGPSFNHIVQQTQKREHALVTTGIYGKLRHPSYFGFFWWGLGTQLAMGNALCLAAYAAVLWRFFSSRIRHEEVFLVKFFGDEYVNYRKQVGTKIPFVS